MSSDNRKRFLTASVIDQDFLDDCQDNLVNELRMAAKIGCPPLNRTGVAYSNPSGNVIRVVIEKHRLKQGDSVTISGATDSALNGVRTVSILGKDSFQFTAGAPPSPGTGTLSVAADRFIYVSDRNMYIGPLYYPARTTFPPIRRTVGEFLSPVLEFDSAALEINNVDQEFNDLLQAGGDFSSWIGGRVTISMGLRDVAATYIDIFRGSITPQAGYNRSTKSFSIVARNDFDRINVSFPKAIFTQATFPDMENDKVNSIAPVIYGDWTADMEPGFASIPAIVVNGADPDVNGDTSNTSNVICVISDHDNVAFQTAHVYLQRGDEGWRIDAADISNVVGNRSFEIAQGGTLTPITPGASGTTTFEFSSGDTILVRVIGKDLGPSDDTNIIAMARDILITYGGLTAGDFHANWAAFEAKVSPVESAISTFKARVYLDESQNALEFALSLLEQVRIEAFIDRDLKIKLLSTHFDEFTAPASIDFTVRNLDVGKDSFQPQLDTRNNFNGAKGRFNSLPNRNREFYQETKIFENQDAIDDTGGEVTKIIEYPNLVSDTVVTNQVKETLKITSSYLEHISVDLTWRALLLDVGDFVKLNIKIQGVQFDEVPAVIREIGYDPVGLKLVLNLWSLQMIPYPGWSPGYAGITGGYTATIQEA